MTDVISTAESRVSEANYPTFETRLVPISEAPKDAEYIFAIVDGVLSEVHRDRDMWREPKSDYYAETEVLYPTHFLQFKINGEWTHEFSFVTQSEGE